MRYMMLYKPGRETSAPPPPEHVAEMGKFIEQEMKAGVLLETGGLQSSAKGARVRISKGDFVVTDGPFAEAKELVGGYAIVQAKSKEEAVEIAKRFLKLVGEGETEIRPMHDPAMA